jgi:organic hydroperoxide reductase OsmC/OhrA
MQKQHHYTSTITWTGNRGSGTTVATEYDRSHTIAVNGKVDILGSSDIPFRGDGAKHNPEDMLVAALSTCHMLWYLHLCADAGVVVTQYIDDPVGTMIEVPGGGGHFTEVTLHPLVTVADAGMIPQAQTLHNAAHKKCFIANSCNFPVRHVPECVVG